MAQPRQFRVVRYDSVADQLVEPNRQGRECYAGLDLSSTTDLSALVLVFPDNARYDVLPFFWVPEEAAHRRQHRDRVPYPLWIRQGHIEAVSRRGRGLRPHS